jgi:hypothetical protein
MLMPSFPRWGKLPSVTRAHARLLVYDRTAGGLAWAWAAGARLYRARGWLDGARGAASWSEAFDYLASAAPDRQLAEIQFWGHGKWGDARIGDERFDVRSLSRGHPHATALDGVRARFAEDALFWFRTCETLGANAGKELARVLGDALGCSVAGHTHVIDFFQSGLHALRPGRTPSWDPAEGLAAGTPERPLRALRSHPALPGTITCLDGQLPEWAHESG